MIITRNVSKYTLFLSGELFCKRERSKETRISPIKSIILNLKKFLYCQNIHQRTLLKSFTRSSISGLSPQVPWKFFPSEYRKGRPSSTQPRQSYIFTQSGIQWTMNDQIISCLGGCPEKSKCMHIA